LNTLVSLGKLIPDEDKRELHNSILLRIAEKLDVTLENEGSKNGHSEDAEIGGDSDKGDSQNDAEEEVRRDEEERERLAEIKRKKEEQQRLDAKKEQERKRQAEENERREREEQNKKRAQEQQKIRQAEQERKEQEKKAEQERAEKQESPAPSPSTGTRRNTFRKSANLSGKSNTGNSLDEVLARVPKPTQRGADLTDPEIAKVYVDVREDNTPTDWMLMGYGDSNNKLKVYGSGSGGFKEFYGRLVDEPLFGYLRYTFGDTSRTKFIFISYSPEKMNGLKKARIAGHKPDVSAFLKYFHVEINALTKDDISQANVESKLRSAGGADYGSGKGGGSNGGENFSSIKANAAQFYAGKDKESSVEIVYAKGPLSTTPCDLSGRPMVAAASAVKKNTVDLKL